MPAREPVLPDARRNRNVGIVSAGVVVAMIGLAYASVPLYRLFCQATGFGGTTQRAEKAPDKSIDRVMTIRFDANVSASLPWVFEPVQRSMDVKVGVENFAHYRATNTSSHDVTGTAVFNVTPEIAGGYFNKIQCFCFTEQTLKPGQTIDLPVSFFVDPAIADDHGLDGVSTITLSYTFYPAKEPDSVSSAPEPKSASEVN
ncbi:MAG: cytochrome c oxidase assembly protein [Parvibaculaceae bacterium]